MNLYNEEIKALRVAIEHINVMLHQPHYKDVEPLLLAKREQYSKELERMIWEDMI